MYSCKSSSFTILCDAVRIPYYDSCDIKKHYISRYSVFLVIFVE